MEFKPTERKVFHFQDDVVVYEVENTKERFGRRLVVNGDPSRPDYWYQGILVHKGYGIVTHYFDNVFIPDTPFKIIYPH